MRPEDLFDPYYALEDGSAFYTMYDLFILEKYPLGLQFKPQQTHEDGNVDVAALLAEFQEWKRTNPIAIRLSKHDKMEAREAGYTDPRPYEDP